MTKKRFNSKTLPLILCGLILSCFLFSMNTWAQNPEFFILPVDEADLTLYGCTATVFSTENMGPEVAFQAGGDGIIAINTAEIPWYYDGVQVSINVTDPPGEYFTSNWDVELYDGMSQLQYRKCMAYLNKASTTENTYCTRKHYWSGMDGINYSDQSRMDITNINNCYYKKNTLYPTITFKSTVDGCFPAKYMTTGYKYEWKVTFKMKLYGIDGTTIKGTTTSPEYFMEADNINGNATDVHVDPTISFTVHRTTCLPYPNQAYTLEVEIVHKVRFKSGNNDWTDWSYYNPAIVSRFIYIKNEN